MDWGPMWQKAPGVLQQAPALEQEKGQAHKGEADLLQIPQKGARGVRGLTGKVNKAGGRRQDGLTRL